MTPNNTDRRFTQPTKPYSVAADPEEHAAFLAPLLQPGFNVLDATAGSASATAEIAYSVLPGKVTLMSESASHLKARRRLIEGLEVRNVDFVAGAAARLPFADCSFDLVFANALPGDDLPAILKEYHRVTRPGGFVGLCRIANEPLEAPATSRKRVTRALNAFHGLAAQPHAGTPWEEQLTANGFVPLAQSSWNEEVGLTHLGQIIGQLDQSGQYHHARELREWHESPAAGLHQLWESITAVRADDYRRTSMHVE